MKARILLLTAAIAGLVVACSSDPATSQASDATFDPYAGEDPSVAGNVVQGKADGIWQDIAYGETKEGSVVGESVMLYEMQGAEGDVIQILASSLTEGFKAGAYLYFGAENFSADNFISPSDYDVTETTVTLNYTLSHSGAHYILVRAYQGDHGTYQLELACAGGPCAGGGSTPNWGPVKTADRCLLGAIDCALDALPSHHGYVGPVTAHDILEDCLASQSLALGVDCSNACEGEGPQRLCNELEEDFIYYADKTGECLQVVKECMEACPEYNPFGYEHFEETSANVCWLDGYTDTCPSYASGHAACGGDSYATGGADECFAMCAAAEGAHYEGPFDACEQHCSDLCVDHLANCKDDCGYDEYCIQFCMDEKSSSRCQGGSNW